MQAACQPVYVRSSGLAVAHVSSSPYWRGATLRCCRLCTAAPTLPFWQRKETDSYSWTIVRVDLALLRCQFRQILVMVLCDLHGCSFSHIWIWICFRCDLGNFALLCFGFICHTLNLLRFAFWRIGFGFGFALLRFAQPRIKPAHKNRPFGQILQ